ncbi:hypothetical protein M5K25_004883 [Dendrobium thyrsiflorum]|uniref:Uncharacterized protein n=1 Tax=Dendrobium thyrsiflorum TaxID=117978 RepID=A0ABD0VGT0_DENTH
MKERASHPSPQQPARFLMPWNRPRTAAAGGDALPEWKLHCLYAEQSLLSPTIRDCTSAAAGSKRISYHSLLPSVKISTGIALFLFWFALKLQMAISA